MSEGITKVTKVTDGGDGYMYLKLRKFNSYEELLAYTLRKGNKARKLVILRDYLNISNASYKQVVKFLKAKVRFLSMGERLAKLAANSVTGATATQPSALYSKNAHESLTAAARNVEKDFVTKIADKGFFQLCGDSQGTVINPELVYKPDVATVYAADSKLGQTYNERVAAALTDPIPTTAALLEHGVMHEAAYEETLAKRAVIERRDWGGESDNTKHMRAALEEYRADPQAYFAKQRDKMNLNFEKRKAFKQRYLNLKKVLNNFTQGH